jgi:hypothetical protein
MSRAPRNSPITEHQWEHIFGILDGACYGSNAVQVAWKWLRSNGSVMQLPTFYERLRKERRARNERAAAGAAEAAAAATAAVLMVDAVPLVGASFVQEGAPEPPAAHGGLAAPPAPAICPRGGRSPVPGPVPGFNLSCPESGTLPRPRPRFAEIGDQAQVRPSSG